MLRNVAVGIDTGPTSQVPLRQAVALAAACSARLHLLAALEERARGEEDLLRPEGGPVLEVALPEEPGPEDFPSLGIPPHLEQARQVCHEEAVPCRLHLHRGEPWPWLARQALVGDLLVVGRRSTHSPRLATCGRTLRRLLPAPPVPLLICGREPAEGRSALVLHEVSPRGARALALTAEICVAFNLPLAVVAAARYRQEAARNLRLARDALYAYSLDCEFLAVEGRPAAALLEVSLERHPSLVAVPASVGFLPPLLVPPLCQAALRVPEAAALVVP